MEKCLRERETVGVVRGHSNNTFVKICEWQKLYSDRLSVQFSTEELINPSLPINDSFYRMVLKMAENVQKYMCQ